MPFDLKDFVEVGAEDFEVKKEFDLRGELWKSRTVGDDFEICLRPEETAKGLLRTNAIVVDAVVEDR